MNIDTSSGGADVESDDSLTRRIWLSPTTYSCAGPRDAYEFWAKLSTDFKVREFRCKDGSDPIFIDSELVEVLQKIRTHFGKAVNINSAFRTASHNAKQKNASHYSQHLYGKAADIWIAGVSVDTLAAYVETLLPNRGGIGRYYTDNFVHVEVRAAKSRWKG